MTRTRKALLALLGLALLKIPLDVLMAAVLPATEVNPVPGCIAGAALSVLLLGLPAWLLRPWTSSHLTQRKPAWHGMFLGAVMALLTRAAMSPADIAWQGWLGLVSDKLPAPQSIPMALVYVLTLAVVPAVAEEAFFRGSLLTALLEGSRRWMALLLTTAAFALMHGSLAELPGLLAIALVLTLVMLHTGQIAAVMTAHFFYNISALVWVGVPGWGSLLCGAALIGLMAYILCRQPKMAHPPMKKAEGLLAAAAMLALAAQYFV